MQLLALIFLAFPQVASALNLVGLGADTTMQDIINNVSANLLVPAVPVCSAIFVGGAYVYAISNGDEQKKSLGKDLMTGAVIGLLVIGLAKGILNFLVFFLYG